MDAPRDPLPSLIAKELLRYGKTTDKNHAKSFHTTDRPIDRSTSLFACWLDGASSCRCCPLPPRHAGPSIILDCTGRMHAAQQGPPGASSSSSRTKARAQQPAPLCGRRRILVGVCRHHRWYWSDRFSDFRAIWMQTCTDENQTVDVKLCMMPFSKSCGFEMSVLSSRVLLLQSKQMCCFTCKIDHSLAFIATITQMLDLQVHCNGCE